MRTIFDIAGLPAVRGHDLVANLVEQAEPYGPRYLLGHRAVELTHGPDLRPVDALTVLGRVEEGQVAVRGYEMDRRLPDITEQVQVEVLGGRQDRGRLLGDAYLTSSAP